MSVHEVKLSYFQVIGEAVQVKSAFIWSIVDWRSVNDIIVKSKPHDSGISAACDNDCSQVSFTVL